MLAAAPNNVVRFDPSAPMLVRTTARLPRRKIPSFRSPNHGYSRTHAVSHHRPVSRNLSDDARGSNAVLQAVASNDALSVHAR